MKRARLIYNPSAGREQVKRQLPYILERLEKVGYEASAHATTGKDCAKRAAKLAAERGFDLVIAAGGDGTINEVINGLAELPYRPKLGLIPAGTTNDFARAIEVPRSIETACDIICNGHEMPIDIGKVNDQYFINIAGGGTLTELTYEVPSKLKTMIGQMAYYAKGIEKLPKIHPVKVRIEYDGKLFEGDIMLFLVSNTNSVGGFEKLAPRASLNDGMFDLIILKKTNLADFVRVASAAARGDHLNDPAVIYVQANRIKVYVEEVVHLNLDGEYGGMLPGEFVNLRHHLQMLVPEKQMLRYMGL
ncbi:diacylglycerol kinase [Anaerobacillus alkaliphilus]|uniref:Diacylglycerol kinase n=1 Tax=Anaerobacillus alkaliphilus TaxID=1548597 RepID=A0A4Q0VXN8_9BACI|nr:diacylglycerol kinase [Anaerobacillus alkaliphilus]RXJ02474.1 diacylglycerol kinase [Anaerobacillus alkaliphilus]